MVRAEYRLPESTGDDGMKETVSVFANATSLV